MSRQCRRPMVVIFDVDSIDSDQPARESHGSLGSVPGEQTVVQNNPQVWKSRVSNDSITRACHLVCGVLNKVVVDQFVGQGVSHEFP